MAERQGDAGPPGKDGVGLGVGVAVPVTVADGVAVGVGVPVEVLLPEEFGLGEPGVGEAG